MEYFPYNWVGNFIPSMTFMQPGVMGLSPPNPWDLIASARTFQASTEIFRTLEVQDFNSRFVGSSRPGGFVEQKEL